MLWRELCVGIGALALGCSSGGSSGGGVGFGGAGGAGGSGGAGGAAFPLPAESYSHGDPTNLEQYALELMQRARANPAAEGALVVDLPEVQNALQQYNVDRNQVVSDFAAYAPVPPLAFHPLLLQSSRAHSTEMGEAGYQEHESLDGTTAEARVEGTGYRSYAGENIFAYAKSVDYAHAAFLIDWGVATLGHRKNALDLNYSKPEIGIGIVENPPHPDVGPLVLTQDFGYGHVKGRRFVVGVVYRDQNENASYDPGEGVAGYDVVPERGGFMATSGASGGFALPVSPNGGALEIQFQLSGQVLWQTNVMVQEENTKVDFVLPREP